MRNEIYGPDKLNPLPTTVDDDSFNSVRIEPCLITGDEVARI